MEKYILFLLIALFSACHSDRANDTEEKNTINHDSLRTVLETMYDTDQGIREQIMAKETFDGELAYQMQVTDSTNMAELSKVLDKYGWLPQSQIGEKAADGMFYVLQHSDQENMQKYFPALNAMAQKGEANTANAAMMEDRILVNQGKKQRFGTQGKGRKTESGEHEYFIWPIEDPAGVNARRLAAGFEQTVEENAARLEAVYNPDEELPKE